VLHPIGDLPHAGRVGGPWWGRRVVVARRQVAPLGEETLLGVGRVASLGMEALLGRGWVADRLTAQVAGASVITGAWASTSLIKQYCSGHYLSNRQNY
jgi:hypothetical protein